MTVIINASMFAGLAKPLCRRLLTLESCPAVALHLTQVASTAATAAAAAAALPCTVTTVGSKGNIKGYATATERATEKAAGAMEDAAEETVKQLHPAFTKFLNSGYMESQRQLRDRLLVSEWDDTVQPWAAAKGVADFEKFIVEKGKELDLHVSWEVMQRLYANPGDTSPLEGNERARLLAQAFITQAQVQQHVEVYKACTETAKQLANVIESGQRTGASTLVGLFKRVLPLPAFLK